MKFREFVQRFSDLESPLGDLANDILRDKDFDDTWNFERVEQYLLFRCGYDDRTEMVKALVTLFASGAL